MGLFCTETVLLYATELMKNVGRIILFCAANLRFKIVRSYLSCSELFSNSGPKNFLV